MSLASFNRVARIALVVLVAGLAGGCASRGAVPDVPDAVDLPRFMGTWQVVAHIPYFAERGHVAARYEYVLRDADKVGVTYHYREGFDQPEQSREARAAKTPRRTVGDCSSCRIWLAGRPRSRRCLPDSCCRGRGCSVAACKRGEPCPRGQPFSPAVASAARCATV